MEPDKVSAATKAAKSLAKAGSLPNRAYVTFLAGDGDYWKGVGCIVREIVPDDQGQNKFAWAYYAINYSNLRMWEYVEHNKMVYLDADVQVFENIDNLFDLPNGYFYAEMDCFCEVWPEQCPDKVKWPQELGSEPQYYFNAGVFVFEPSFSTYADLLKTLEVTPPTAYAEQDLLNMVFKDIYMPILPNYNFLVAMLWRHPEEIELDKVKVVHYCASGSKPWKYTGKEENMDREDIKMIVKNWWDIYDDETLDFERNKDGLVVDEHTEVETVGFMASLPEAGVIHYIAAPTAA
ncbi:hypothetical protein ACH5RR_001677 [Cinchona calisaya]|uniref:Hexosyltransferase n=1 Tax=Cinchona calisaya TaxID=153742 RepID=A0ABD3B4Q7_9GENT